MVLWLPCCLGTSWPNYSLGSVTRWYLTEQPDGGLLVSAQMPDREAQLREARDILDKRRNVLRPLAD